MSLSVSLVERIKAYQAQQPEELEGLPRTAVLTIRVPTALRLQLGAAAESRSLSMNRLCVLALEQALAELQASAGAKEGL